MPQNKSIVQCVNFQLKITSISTHPFLVSANCLKASQSSLEMVSVKSSKEAISVGSGASENLNNQCQSVLCFVIVNSNILPSRTTGFSSVKCTTLLSRSISFTKKSENLFRQKAIVILYSQIFRRYLFLPLLDDAAEAWIVADIFGDTNVHLGQPGALRAEGIARTLVLMTKLAFVFVVAFELPLLELAHLKAKQQK